MSRLVLSLVPLSQGAVGVSEKHVHARAWGEALVAGHFPALVPGQCAHRPVGQDLDAAGQRAGPGRLSYPEAGPQ